MFSKLIRLVSLGCCLFVLASFGLFVHDQLSHASSRQQQELAAQAGQSGRAASGSPRHAAHPGEPRHFIDDVAGKLTHPFRTLVTTRSVWVLELFSTFLALLVYGVGLGFIARFASGSRHGVLLKPV